LPERRQRLAIDRPDTADLKVAVSTTPRHRTREPDIHDSSRILRIPS
jgi:hypothetical protein